MSPAWLPAAAAWALLILAVLVLAGLLGRYSARWQPALPRRRARLESLAAGGIAAAAALVAGTTAPEATALAALAQLGLALIRIDCARLMLPDPLILALALLGFAWSLAGGPGAPLPAAAAAGGGLGAGLLGLIRAAHGRLRGYEGLGLGDVKLAGALGLWVGAAAVGHLILLAALLGLAFALLSRTRTKPGDRGDRGQDQSQPLAFGPALTLAGLTLIVSALLRGGAGPGGGPIS